MLETRGDVKPPNDFLSLKNRVFLKGWRREILKKFRIAPMINDTGGVKSLRQDS
jgi:hypothetical protein